MAKNNKSGQRRSARTTKKQQAAQRKQRTNMLILGGVVVIFVIGLIVAGGGLGEGPSPEVAQERLDLDPILGPETAQVTIVEYGAYGCTACRAFHQSRTIERILNDYPGQVNFTFRDFPVIDPVFDQRAARVAQCVLDQGEEIYWEFHDVLYTTARIGEDTESLIEWADAIGADDAEVQTCVDERRHARTVEYDEDRAINLGLRSTPSFTVNGQRVIGGSETALREAVEAALSS